MEPARPRAGELNRSGFRQFHRAFEFRFFPLDAKIVVVELTDLFHLVARQRRTLGRFGEFNELCFFVDVREGRRDTIVSEEPLQRRLAEGAIRVFQETEALNFFHAVEEPTSWTM